MKPFESGEQTIFDTASRITGASDRAAYLDRACADDPKLRERVEALLRASARADAFLAAAPQAAVPPLSAFLAATLTEKPGDRIGRFKLLEKIGEGGCGVVYMAEQEEPVRRKVALKIIKLGMDTKGVIARFEAERQALALMDHTNIAKVLEAGATETGRPYFVMELVGGIKITDYCEQNNLTTRQRLDLFIQVCRAIQHAHQKGIIHRDIKPSNVLVATQDGVAVPKVIDFGIAKATQGRLTDQTVFTAFEQFLGTPAYMSPEQAQAGGLDVDTRSDIYSLGVLLYELLTGKTPFDAKELLAAGLEAMRRTIQEKEPPTPSTRLKHEVVTQEIQSSGQSRSKNQKSKIANDLDWIVMKCLEKDRGRRYETANGIARDIERHLSNEPVVAGPPSRLYRFRKLVRRNRVTSIATTAVTGVLVVGVVVSTWQAWRATRAEAKSQQVTQFLTDMLEGAGPSKALGRDTTMLKEILDKTAERVSQELTNQPRVEIEIRDVLARTYDDLSFYPEAEAMLRENLRIARAHFGEEDIAVAQALKVLSLLQLHQGHYGEAEKSARAAMAIYRKVLGEQDREVATSLDNLASALQYQSRYPEAEAARREALAMRRKLLGNEAAEVAVSLSNLAMTLQEEGELAEAEPITRESLVLLRKIHGDEHTEVATALNNLALLLFEQGKMAEAEALNRQALAMRRKILGDSHPEIAQSLHNLAMVLHRQDKLVEAETLLREGLELQKKRLGNEHPELTFTLNSLGTVLLDQGKLAEAETISRETLQMRRKLLGEENDLVSVSLNNLANVLREQGRLPEAEATYREALALKRKLLGDEHPQIAATLLNLAQVLVRQDRSADAEALVQEALKIRRKALGEAHPETATAVNNLVQVLLKENKLAEAQALGQELVAGMRARLPADDPQLARALYDLAATLLLAEKFTEAEPAARECLAIREKIIPDEWRTFSTRSLLGASLLRQQKYADSEPLLLSGYQGMQQRITNADKVQIEATLKRLVQLYDATGQTNQAAQWKKTLEDFDQAQTDRFAPSAPLKPPNQQ